MKFGERLQTLRKEKNLSQEELARILNVSRQTISRWESSLSSPDLEMLEKICQYFHMTYDEFLQNKPIQKKSYLPYIFIILFIIIIFLSFLLPNSTEDFTGSAIVMTPAGFCLLIGVTGLLLTLILSYRNHRK
ncbi:helix-turn-helix domain-containing protein [Candidatus Stoquefichus massiliensis]|uniref:helix-turn-helix domain-containing protein n=1 Tax=Candidatus Stoquefichus massiliensis TaxID=1470350 RepID=UPI0004B3838E|nr:helix-turn-helix transcriptional regulator [Candidatus Stoquefichus massiliensis]